MIEALALFENRRIGWIASIFKASMPGDGAVCMLYHHILTRMHS
jgi:hypothetical protein